VSKNIYYYSINDVCYKRAYTHADSAIRKKKASSARIPARVEKMSGTSGRRYITCTRRDRFFCFPTREGDASMTSGDEAAPIRA
jgi:hypothetical protein